MPNYNRINTDGEILEFFRKGGSKTNKDSCYYAAKRAHKVFPSAYASGMIAKCRKRKARK